jgi:hypothetical protein
MKKLKDYGKLRNGVNFLNTAWATVAIKVKEVVLI